MMQVYLDNAATTPLDPEVVRAMTEVMETVYGNPSSIHAHGRTARTIIEKARKAIAARLNAAPSSIFFTSGGTEADNMAIRRTIADLNIANVITSPLEHHAVLHTLEDLERTGKIRLNFVSTDDKGAVDLTDLEQLLSREHGSFVSLMHANNEVGTLTDISAVGEMCAQYGAIFHSDTVQTMGHYIYDVAQLKAHFLTCAAHKLHGPKGVGFIYIHPDVRIRPLLYGGPQERNMRGGTENLYGIVGLAKAFDIVHERMEEDRKHIQDLKYYMIDRLREEIPGVSFNGETDPAKSLYTVLNVSFPDSGMADMFLFSLDIAGISASGGSACSSGTNIGSHVLSAIQADPNRPAVRFSFSKFNTRVEIDFAVAKLKEICRN